MSERDSNARQFEHLAHRILESHGFRVEWSADRGRDLGFDFLAFLADEIWAIEAKYYRTARAQVSLIQAAASRLVARALVAQAAKGMLVVSCVLPPALRESLAEQFALTFIDRIDLLNWAAKSPA